MTLHLAYATEHLGKAPMSLRLTDITPDLVLEFLAHPGAERHNSVRSRNLRLTALRAFLKLASRRDLSALHAVEQVMTVPMKRFERPMLGHLTRPEMIAVLGQPGSGWTSLRDHLLYRRCQPTGDVVITGAILTRDASSVEARDACTAPESRTAPARTAFAQTICPLAAGTNASEKHASSPSPWARNAGTAACTICTEPQA